MGVGYMMMPSPKGSARFAQLSRGSRAARPHQRQGSALHPMLDTRHPVPWIQRASKAVIGRAEVQSKFTTGGRGHDRAARLRFLGMKLSDHRPLRGFRRATCSANIRYRGRLNMPAEQACMEGGHLCKAFHYGGRLRSDLTKKVGRHSFLRSYNWPSLWSGT